MSARSKFFPQAVTVADVVEYRASWSTWKSGVTKAKAQQNIRSFVKFVGRADLLPVLDTIIKSEEDNARLAPRPFSEAELKELLAQVPVTFWLKIKRQKMKKKEGGKVQQKLDAALHKELLAVTNGNPRCVFWSGEGTAVSAVTNWQTI